VYLVLTAFVCAHLTLLAARLGKNSRRGQLIEPEVQVGEPVVYFLSHGFFSLFAIAIGEVV
jgi:hypothetical protein